MASVVDHGGLSRCRTGAQGSGVRVGGDRSSRGSGLERLSRGCSQNCDRPCEAHLCKSLFPGKTFRLLVRVVAIASRRLEVLAWARGGSVASGGQACREHRHRCISDVLPRANAPADSDPVDGPASSACGPGDGRSARDACRPPGLDVARGGRRPRAAGRELNQLSDGDDQRRRSQRRPARLAREAEEACADPEFEPEGQGRANAVDGRGQEDRQEARRGHDQFRRAEHLVQWEVSGSRRCCSSRISRERNQLRPVRIAATAASFPISSKVGATAVRSRSEASWNSRPSAR